PEQGEKARGLVGFRHGHASIVNDGRRFVWLLCATLPVAEMVPTATMTRTRTSWTRSVSPGLVAKVSRSCHQVSGFVSADCPLALWLAFNPVVVASTRPTIAGTA